MKYKSSILVKLPVEDHLKLKSLAEIRRTTVNSILREAILSTLKAEGMDPMADKKPPASASGGGINQKRMQGHDNQKRTPPISG